VRDVLSTILLDDGDSVSVTAHNGIVTLSGTMPKQDLIPVAVRLASDVDGVVAVRDKLSAQPVAPAAN
jgi:osmotically-inducible protein OsmY